MNKEKIITDIVFDTICVITIWGLLNNSHINNYINDQIDNIISISTSIIGVSISIYIISKYI